MNNFKVGDKVISNSGIAGNVVEILGFETAFPVVVVFDSGRWETFTQCGKDMLTNPSETISLIQEQRLLSGDSTHTLVKYLSALLAQDIANSENQEHYNEILTNDLFPYLDSEEGIYESLLSQVEEEMYELCTALKCNGVTRGNLADALSYYRFGAGFSDLYWNEQETVVEVMYDIHTNWKVRRGYVMLWKYGE